MAGRTLTDGAWDSWAFELFSVTPSGPAFAEGPTSAASPYPPGDFNRDGQVDLADYPLWKSEFGETDEPNVDANGNGVVDLGDYTIWRNHLGDGARLSTRVESAVPEPPGTCFVLYSLGVFWQLLNRKRKERN
jgi:hypothetical protein